MAAPAPDRSMTLAETEAMIAFLEGHIFAKLRQLEQFKGHRARLQEESAERAVVKRDRREVSALAGSRVRMVEE